MLEKKHCVPCEGGTPPLLKKDIDELLKQLKSPWEVIATERIQRDFIFPDFKEALAFVNRIGAVAESEGHHPDIYLSWGEVSVELTTHAIGGLSENDFIVARKIEELYDGKGKNKVFI
jgi:4a-hydroxytetrahydrobiopterin dehydratase